MKPMILGTQRVKLSDVLVDLKLNARREYDGAVKSDGKPDDKSETIESLAESIARDGLIHPISVEGYGPNKYRVRAGFRRALALNLLAKAKKAPSPFWVEVNIVESDRSEGEYRAFQLTENLKRNDLTPPEIADQCVVMIDTDGLKVDKVGEMIGKSRSYVSNLYAAAKNLIPPADAKWRAGTTRLAMPDVVALCHKSPEDQVATWQKWIDDGKVPGVMSDGSLTVSDLKPPRGKSGKPAPATVEAVAKFINESIPRESDAHRAAYLTGLRDMLMWHSGALNMLPGIECSAPKSILTPEQKSAARKQKADAEKNAKEAAKVEAFALVAAAKAEAAKILAAAKAAVAAAHPSK